MSLIHWWPLNGNTNDMGISPCTVSGTPTFAANGKIGKCLSDGALTMPAAATAQVFNKDAVSVCFWLYNGGSSGCIFGTDQMTPPNNRRFTLFQYPTANDLHWSWQNEDSGGTFTEGVASGAIPSNAWTHICAVWDNGTARIYANGTQVGTSTGTCTSTNWAFDTVIVRPNSARYFNDIRIYNHALSAKEVKEISKGLILHYNFEDKCSNLIPAFSADSSQGVSIDNTTHPFNLGPIYKLSQSGNTSNVYRGLSYTIPGLKAGDVIWMSCWIYTENKASVDAGSEFRIFQRHTDETINWNGYNWINPQTDGKWCYHSKKYILDSNLSSAVFNINIIKNGTFWITGIKVEHGNNTTSFDGYKETTTTIYDNSGYGNNGTISSDSTFKISSTTVSGRHSGQFDGTATSFINAGQGAKVTDEITVSWWGYMDNWTNYGRAISCTEGGGWNFEPGDSKMTWWVYLAGIGYKGCYSIKTLAELTAGWHLFTGTYDGFTSKFYIDGELQSSVASGVTAKTAIGYAASNSIFIGAEATGSATTPTSPYFSGNIADVKIYATALSEADVKAEYNRKAAIDKNGNLFTGEFIETNTNANIADKNNQIKATYFVEGKEIVKIFGGYTELDYFDQVNPAAGAASQHNRCQILDISYDHIEAMVKVTGQGSSGGIVFSNGMWWKAFNGRGTVNDGSGTVTMTPASFSQDVWTDVSWDFSKVFSGLWTSGWSDSINYWTPQNLKVAYIKTYIGSEVTGHFIPVKNKNNVIGLFNLITNKFYSNTGTGTESFVAGNSLGNLSLIQENKIEEL